MNEKDIIELIKGIRQGKISQEEALIYIKNMPFADLGHTKVDHHRGLRQGVPEVVFAQGKQSRELVSIIAEMVKRESEVLLTRVSDKQAGAIKKKFRSARHNPTGRTVRVPGKARKRKAKNKSAPVVAVVSAGTSDAPVVEEALETLDWLGIPAERMVDVGVAGIHRVLSHRQALESARAVIVVAGMEGALASVVGGLVKRPVIAVPTSVGYGAGAGGMAALLGMLNSCAAGVTVVNIDNGFGAACAAARVLKAAEAE